MFLSRMALDIGQEDTQNLVRSPTLQREMVYSAFPSSSGLVLWRMDSIEGRMWIVILSPIRPDLRYFHQQCGYQGVFPSWDITDYDDILDNLDLRNTLNFEVCFCPFSSVRMPRDYLQDMNYIRSWLESQEKHGGFDISNILSITSCWKMVDSKYTLYAWIEGKLWITDLPLFRSFCSGGIGENLDTGAGLMTVSENLSVWM